MLKIFKEEGSSNLVFGCLQDRNASRRPFEAKAYTYRITAKADIKYLKDKGEEDDKFDEFIKKVTIREMFDKSDLPCVLLNLAIPSNRLRSLLDDYRNSRILITIKRYEEIDRSVDRQPVTIWEDKPFVILDMPKAPLSEDTSGKDPTSVGVAGESITDITLKLIDEDSYYSNKTLFNFVANNVTVGEVIQFLVSKNLKNKNILIGAPDNTTKYEQILIPPLNFPEALKYLDKNYGIYKNGMIYFIGINDLIICDKIEKVKSLKDPITDISIIARNGSASNPNAGMFRSTVIDKSDAGLYTAAQPVIKTSDMSLKEIFGESIVLNSKNTANDLVGGGGVKNEFPGKERYYWSQLNREDLATALQLEINEGVEKISMTIENSDINIFDIAKNVSIQFEYKVNEDYKGTYRIMDNTHTFLIVEPSEDPRDTGEGKLMKLITRFSIVRV